MAYYLGIDLGGTKINGLILRDNHAEPVIQRKIPTEGKYGADAVLERIAQLCNRGETLLMPNIPGDWYKKPVEAQLEKLLNHPAWLLNDARSFTLAEAKLGAGKGYPVVTCFTLGTGIGGGVAINGALHLGLGGGAGEFGHSTVHVDGLPDGSGTPGAIEAYGSGPAIAAAGVKAVMQGVNTSIGKLVDYDLNKITPHTILQAAQEGDEVALRILDDAGKYLGAGVANVVTVFAPHCIV